MQRYDQVSPIPPLTKVTKAIIIACVVMFFVDLILSQFNLPFKLVNILGLVPLKVMQNFWLWQFVTYIFMHGNELHLLLNMLILWYFGSEIEMRLGEKGFLQYFFLTGIGAGLFNFLTCVLFRDPAQLTNATIGASGAVYGILIAYGIFFGSRYMLVFFIFPLQAKYFVCIMAGLELIFSMKASPQDNVAHVAHLGGMLIGGIYLYFRYIRPRGTRKMTKKDQEREKLKKQFTLIVNQPNKNDDKDNRGPYWN